MEKSEEKCCLMETHMRPFCQQIDNDVWNEKYLFIFSIKHVSTLWLMAEEWI